MRTLSVLWLHAPENEADAPLHIVEYGLTDAFRDFCHLSLIHI